MQVSITASVSELTALLEFLAGTKIPLQVAEAASAPQPEPATEPVTYEELKTSFLALTKAKGNAFTRTAILEPYGADKLPDVPVEHWPAVRAAIRAAMDP